MDLDLSGESIQKLQAELAIARTALAMERTLLAWIRTSLSLIAFGFTLAKFVHDLIKTGTLAGIDAQYPIDVGITLMVLGIGGLLGGAFDHWRSMRKLQSSVKISVWSASLIVALLLAVLGLGLMSNLLTNLHPHN